LKELLEDETFYTGVSVGINLYQNAIITAHKRKEPLIIEDTFYYLQDGRERLAQILNEICR